MRGEILKPSGVGKQPVQQAHKTARGSLEERSEEIGGAAQAVQRGAKLAHVALREFAQALGGVVGAFGQSVARKGVDPAAGFFVFERPFVRPLRGDQPQRHAQHELAPTLACHRFDRVRERALPALRRFLRQCIDGRRVGLRGAKRRKHAF